MTSSILTYKTELEKIVSRLDISEEIISEVLLAFDDLIEELEIEPDQSLEDLIDELGAPKEFISDYLETRFYADELLDKGKGESTGIVQIHVDGPVLRRRIKSGLKSISSWPKLPPLLFWLVIFVGLSSISFTSGFFLSRWENPNPTTSLSAILVVSVFFFIIYSVMFSFIYLIAERKWKIFGIWVFIWIVFTPVLNTIIFGFSLSDVYRNFFIEFFSMLYINVIFYALGFGATILLMFQPGTVLANIRENFPIMTIYIGLAVVMIWGSLIYYTTRFLAPYIIRGIEKLYPESEIEIEDDVGEKHVIPYKNYVQQLKYTIQDRQATIETPNMVQKLLHKLRVNSLTNGKFTPQFDNVTKYGFAVLILVGGLGVILQFFGFQSTSIFLIYIVYEIFSGITGYHFTSRRLAAKIRYTIRLELYTAVILTYLFDLVNLLSPNLGNYMLGWIFPLVYLEIVIFLRENIPGLIPMEGNFETYTLIGIFKTLLLVLAFFVLWLLATGLTSVFSILVTMVILFFIQTLPHIGNLRINSVNYPIFSFLSIQAIYWFAYNNANYFIQITDPLPAWIYWYAFILGTLTCGLGFYNYFEFSNSISKYYTEEASKDLEEYSRLFDLIERIEIQLHNFLIRYKLKIAFAILISFGMVLVSQSFALFNPPNGDEVFSDVIDYYYMLHEFYFTILLLTIVLAMLIFFLIIEINQDQINTDKQVNSLDLSLRQFLNVKKVFLAIMILLVVSSSYIATVEYNYSEFYHYRTGPEPDQLLYADLRAEVYTFGSQDSFRSQLIEFVETTNVDPSVYSFTDVKQYLPILKFDVSISTDDWRPTIPLILINQTLYNSQVESWSDDEPYQFDDKFYFAREFFYEDVVEQVSSDELTLFDGINNYDIPLGNLTFLDRNLGLHNDYQEMYAIYVTFETYEKLGYPLQEYIEINGAYDNLKLDILFDHEEPRDFFDERKNEDYEYEDVVFDLQDEVENALGYNPENYDVGITVHTQYQPALDNSYLSQGENEFLQDISFLVLLFISSIIGLVFYFDLCRSGLLRSRNDRLKTFVTGLVLFSLFSVLGLIQGLLSSEFVFQGSIRSVNPDFNLIPLLIITVIEIGIFSAINFLGILLFDEE